MIASKNSDKPAHTFCLSLGINNQWINRKMTNQEQQSEFAVCVFSHKMSWMKSGTELSQFSEGFPTESFSILYIQ